MDPNMTCLLFFSKPSLQSTTLVHFLEAKLNHPIKVIDTSCMNRGIPEANEYVVLIDLSVNHSTQDLSNILYKHAKKTKTVLINTADTTPLEELIIWPNLFGMFKHSDDINMVYKGLKSILNGESWLSRKVLNQLLEYYKTNANNIPSAKPLLPEVELTRREAEILQTLKTGASNIEIADKLFISEHTIKSHLYNIFKKLEVKNRLQAMSWAKQNLD